MSDGRFLGFAEYGNTGGEPVLLFHGTPGSRLWFEGHDPVADELGLRLVAVDRPGHGLSDLKRNSRYSDWPGDVEQLADALELERFAVLSVSGGGPWALSCALGLPTRVSRAAVVSGPSPIRTAGDVQGMARANRRGFGLARVAKWAPWLARWLLRRAVSYIRENPDSYFDRLAKEVSESDRRIVAQEKFRRQVHREMLEAYRSGVEGVLNEMVLLTVPWGLTLDEITMPVALWHGSDDTLAPVKMAETMHKALPNSTLHVIPGAGHFLLDDENNWRTILDWVRHDARHSAL